MNQPKYRRPLNDKQLAILETLYRFRFVTAPLLAKLLNIKPSKAHDRLQVLLEQNYIGRRYDKSYRLQGKAASYYLLPKSTQALADTNDEKYLPSVLKRLAKDEGRSDRFINHWLGVLNVYCSLHAIHGDRLRFFTNTELVGFNYFIQPRPDAYIRLANRHQTGEQQFFLDLLGSDIPRFAIQGRVRGYIEYAEAEEWQERTKSPLPAVVLVCDEQRLKGQLKRIIKAELEDSLVEDDLKIHITTASDLEKTMLDSL